MTNPTMGLYSMKELLKILLSLELMVIPFLLFTIVHLILLLCVCGKTCEDQTSLKDHIDIVLSIHDQTLTNACYSCGIVFQS